MCINTINSSKVTGGSFLIKASYSMQVYIKILCTYVRHGMATFNANKYKIGGYNGVSNDLKMSMVKAK